MKNNNWINPVDKMPEEGQEVLITVEGGTRAFGSIFVYRSVMQAQFHNDPSFSGKYYPLFSLYDLECTELTKEVVAWMPMPEPYREEADK